MRVLVYAHSIDGSREEILPISFGKKGFFQRRLPNLKGVERALLL